MKRELSDVLSALRGLSEQSGPSVQEQSESADVTQHLQILRHALEPDLSLGRRRVLEEAARMDMDNGPQGMERLMLGQRIGVGVATVILIGVVLGMASVAPGWIKARGTDAILGLFSTATLAPTHLTEASATNVIDATPNNGGAPRRSGISRTAIPVDSPLPVPVATATAGPLLTLTRSAQAFSAR
jgi:hypothetical protein